MPRIPELSNDAAEGNVRELFAGAEAQMGLTPNVFRAMGHSHAVLSSFMTLLHALQNGKLDRKLQQKIAVRVAQFNRSPYCLSVNTALGKHVGLTEDALVNARLGNGADAKETAVLQFVATVLQHHGNIENNMFQALVDVGFTYEEIAEIIANISVNIFANYFNIISNTNPDFPSVELDLTR